MEANKRKLPTTWVYQTASCAASYEKWEKHGLSLVYASTGVAWSPLLRCFYKDAQELFFRRWHMRTGGNRGGNGADDKMAPLERLTSPDQVPVRVYAISAGHPPLFVYKHEGFCASLNGLFLFGRVLPTFRAARQTHYA
ncbi:unnamed protein product [Amoebophrya sp. A25]|nr:unnamed protein product [Amoebophrya sp. A25]|eukprot:GSA25T00015600001.1